MKGLGDKRTQFHTYKLKEERSNRVVLKNVYYSINPEEIKTEIENLGHTVTIIWNFKQYRPKLPFSMFFVERKPAPKNKNICNVHYINIAKINSKIRFSFFFTRVHHIARCITVYVAQIWLEESLKRELAFHITDCLLKKSSTHENITVR
jgi:hypothetical protein